MSDLTLSLRTEGIKRLLADGLQMGSGQILLIFFQEELSDLATSIKEMAESLDIEVELRKFKARDFDGGYPPAFAPAWVSNTAAAPRGIILLIEWSPKTTKGRLELLHDLEITGRPWRIASMPGVLTSDLEACRAPITEIKERSLRVFAALARARHAIVQTRSPAGTTDQLNIPLGDYCPIISTGEIKSGSWGNFPSGETFVVPNEYKSSGWMTLRGSFPDYVLQEGEWIRFQVWRGRLRYNSVEASSLALKERFLNLFFSPEGKLICPNANAIAELGVGTNSFITQLTGKPIFDEKRIGSIHLGLGRNRQFKGHIDSEVHHDITCVDVILEIPPVRIVMDNQLTLTQEEATPSLRDLGSRSRRSGRRFTQSASMDYSLNAATDQLEITYYPLRGDPEKLPFDVSGLTEIAEWIVAKTKPWSSITLSMLLREAPQQFDRKDIECAFWGLVEFHLLEAVRGARK